MKLTESTLRELIRKELISLEEGVKGYDIGPKLDDFDGMDFYNAQYEISDDDGFTDAVDEDGWKSIFKIAKKYKSKLKKHGIKSEKDLENFAKWLSGGEHMKSESVVNEGAPKMAKNEEAENIQELMNQIANAQKGGGSGRYGKEFDKAKTKALRAINDMVTYAKIGR